MSTSTSREAPARPEALGERVHPYMQAASSELTRFLLPPHHSSVFAYRGRHGTRFGAILKAL